MMTDALNVTGLCNILTIKAGSHMIKKQGMRQNYLPFLEILVGLGQVQFQGNIASGSVTI